MTGRTDGALLVDTLGNALRRGGSSLNSVPGLLKQVLSGDVWREFTTQRGDIVTYTRFEDFATALPLKGLGADVDLIRRIIGDDPEAVDLLDRALAGRQGRRTDLFDNVKEVEDEPAPTGNTQTAALRSLRKNAPDLHTEVLAGHLSAHAAMVQAGLRPRTFTVRADSPTSIAAALRKNLSPEDLAELSRLLQ